MMIETLHSPNFSKKKRANYKIKLIVIHYTGMQSKIESIKRLRSLRAKVSCHYLIDRRGKVIKMVEENKVAWHAGKSKWKNFKNLNNSSIGIELVNRGFEFGYENYTNSQIKKLIELCLILKKRFKIKNSNIIGHSDIAPLRKQDPGEKFPWLKLKKNNLGIWYEPIHFNKKIDKKKLPELFFKNLFKIGYRYFNRKKRGINDYLVVKAFQRRFLPNGVNGKIDQKTYIISHFLANKIKN